MFSTPDSSMPMAPVIMAMVPTPAALSAANPTAEVARIPSSDYPTPARRPANSLLSHDAIHDAYGITPRDWRDALSDILDELIGAKK